MSETHLSAPKPGRARLTSALTWLAILCALIPPIIMARYLLADAIDYPYTDTWKSADIAIAAHDGTLTFQQLVAQPGVATEDPAVLTNVNYQRVFFTNLVTAILGWLLAWPIRYEAYASWWLNLLTCLALIDLFRRQMRGAAWAVALPFSALLFSFLDFRNWGWGFQNAYFFAMFFFTAVLWVIDRWAGRWWGAPLAALCAAAATFSSPVGLLSWAAGLALLVARGRRWALAAGWIAALMVTAGLYAWGLQSTGSTHPFHSLSQLGIMLDLIAKPYYLNDWFLLPIAALLAADAVWLWRSGGRLPLLVTWGALIAYTLSAGFQVSIIRIDVVPRHFTLSIPFWLGSAGLSVAAILTIMRLPARGRPLIGLAAANGLFLALTAFLVVQAGLIGATRVPLIADGRDCFLAYPLTRDRPCARDLSVPNLVDTLPAQQSDRLLDARLSVFSDIRPLPIDGYHAGDAVVVDSSDPVDHVWTAYTDQQQSALHIMPKYRRDKETPPSRFAASILSDASPASQARFTAFLSALAPHTAVWYVRPNPAFGGDGRPFGAAFLALLSEAGFAAGASQTISMGKRSLLVTGYKK